MNTYVVIGGDSRIEIQGTGIKIVDDIVTIVCGCEVVATIPAQTTIVCKAN